LAVVTVRRSLYVVYFWETWKWIYRMNSNGGPSPLVLLAVAVIVVAGGILLATKLRDLGRVQDCILSGRSGCAPIETR
jgi:hypothetical protein